MTFAVKDVIDIAGVPTGFGNPDWLASHPVPVDTASVVERLLQAGASLVGKTHTDELAYSLTGENTHYGTPRHPLDPSRVPGGSSNGSAVAVAGGLVDFALGTDCGGSVRVPASYCGIYGFRPSHGRVPVDGVIPFGPSFDVVGWFTRSADLLRDIGSVLLPEDDTPLTQGRLLIARDAFELVPQSVSDALFATLEAIVPHFRTAEEITVSDRSLDDWRRVFQVIQAAEIWENLGSWIRAAKPMLGPGIKERFDYASRITTEEADDARRQRKSIRERLAALLENGNVLCLPTVPRPAPHRNLPVAEIETAMRNQALGLLCIAGLGGLPQVTMPLAQLDGLPLGLSLVAASDTDRGLLGLSRTLAGEA